MAKMLLDPVEEVDKKLLASVEKAIVSVNAVPEEVRLYAPKVVPDDNPTMVQGGALVDHLATLSGSDVARSQAVQDTIRKVIKMETEYRVRWEEEMKIIEEALDRIGKLRNTPE
jgi:hypothetical protein